MLVNLFLCSCCYCNYFSPAYVNRWPRLQRFYRPNESCDWLREYRTRHKVGIQIRRTVESISKRFFTEVVSCAFGRKTSRCYSRLPFLFPPRVHHFLHVTCTQLFLFFKLTQKSVTQPCVGQVLGDSFAEIESLGMPEHFCEDELLFILNSDKR